MKNIKKIIAGIFIGVGVGAIGNLIFSYIYGAYSPGVPSFLEQYSNILTGVTVEFILYALIGVSQIYGSEIMDNEKRGLFKNTIMHYLFIVIPLIVVGYILHWGEDLRTMVFVGIGISIVYFVIWVAMYFSIKAEIKKINVAIKKNYRSKGILQ